MNGLGEKDTNMMVPRVEMKRTLTRLNDMYAVLVIPKNRSPSDWPAVM